MPVSAAAIAGISYNRHRWKHSINLARLTEQIGDFDDSTPEEDIEAIRDRIVITVEGWLTKRTVVADEAMVEAIGYAVENLRDIAPDLDELRAALNDLFDEFDFYRVVSV